MWFTELSLDGAYQIEPDPYEDDRGLFARVFCKEEFSQKGLATQMVQSNTSFNPHEGTLRGMHFQRPPHREAKLVRCTRGSIFDVMIDLRPGSPTHTEWYGAELTEDNRRMLYVPEGFAHGFLTLEPQTEVFYQVSEFYAPEAEGGVRWNDPTFDIDWPTDPQIISKKDRNLEDYDPGRGP